MRIGAVGQKSRAAPTRLGEWMGDRVLRKTQRTGAVQQRKARAGSWTVRKRAAFLAELAATANVRAAARAAKMSEQGAYQLRKRDTGFAIAWGTALCEGYAKLEMLMLERAIAGMAGDDVPTSDSARAVTLSERTILSLLTHHRQTVRGLRAADATPERGDDLDARAQIADRLDTMHARLRAIDGGE